MVRYGTILFLFVFLQFAGTNCARAQKIDESDTRSLIYANFLYQFANNCNWPTEAKKGKFYIGVLGNNDIFEATKEKFGSKPVGSQVIEVVALTSVPTTQFFQILFVDKSRKADLAKALKELKNKNTIIVTNWDDALNQGSMINFKQVNGSIRYEMNVKAIEEKNITPGVKIIQWKVD